MKTHAQQAKAERRRLRARDRAKAQRRAEAARHIVKKVAPFRTEFQATVERMTNHQRNKWARNEYPGLLHREVGPLWRFVQQKRPA